MQDEQNESFSLARLFPDIFESMQSVSDKDLKQKLSPQERTVVEYALLAFADLANLDSSRSESREMLIEEIQAARVCLTQAAQLCLDDQSSIASDDCFEDNEDAEDNEDNEDAEDAEGAEEINDFQHSDEVLSAGSPMVRKSSVTGAKFKEPWKPRASKNRGIKEKNLQDCDLPNGHHSHSERFRHKNRAAKAANEAGRRQDANVKRVEMEAL